MLAEREGAFVESFLRAFQLLRTAAQNHYLVQAWTVRAFHAFQSLRLSQKRHFVSKAPPFLFQLSGIGMFLAVLLPSLEPPVPPDSCTFRPCSPRLTAHRFVEILPGVFCLPGIVSEPVLPAPQRIEFVVFAANVQSTRHSHALKVVSCRKPPLPFSNFPESCPPCRLHSSRSIHALSDLPPSQPNIPFIEPPAAPFLKISTRPGSAVEGFLLFSPLRRDISPFHHIDALSIPLPFPEIRNPKRTAAALVPALSYFPKHKKTAASSSLAAVSV